MSWTCTNTKNESVQERERTTTTSTTITGIVSAIARDNRNQQITGFNLTGYTAPATESSSATDGPPVNSCPDKWLLTTPAGAPTVVNESSTGTLSATYGGTTKALLTF